MHHILFVWLGPHFIVRSLNLTVVLRIFFLKIFVFDFMATKGCCTSTIMLIVDIIVYCDINF